MEKEEGYNVEKEEEREGGYGGVMLSSEKKKGEVCRYVMKSTEHKSKYELRPKGLKSAI